MPTRTDTNLPIAHSVAHATIALPAMVPDTLMLGGMARELFSPSIITNKTVGQRERPCIKATLEDDV